MMWPRDVVHHGEKGRHDGQSLDEMALFNRGGDEPVGCRRTAQRVTGTGDFFLARPPATQKLLPILEAELLPVDRKISWAR